MASPLEADQRNSPLALRSKQPPVSQRHPARDRQHMRSQRLMLAVCVFWVGRAGIERTGLGRAFQWDVIDEWLGGPGTAEAG